MTRPFLQARRRAVSLRVRVLLAQALAVHHHHSLSLRAVRPVTQHSLHLRVPVAHLQAVHRPLRARVSKSYRANTGIQLAKKAAIPSFLWDLARLSLVALITVSSGLDSHLGRMIAMVSRDITAHLYGSDFLIRFLPEKL